MTAGIVDTPVCDNSTTVIRNVVYFTPTARIALEFFNMEQVWLNEVRRCSDLNHTYTVKLTAQFMPKRLF